MSPLSPTLRTWMRSVPPRGSVGSSWSLRSELGCGQYRHAVASGRLGPTLRTWMRSRSELGCGQYRHAVASGRLGPTLRIWMQSVPPRGSVGSSWSYAPNLDAVTVSNNDFRPLRQG